MKTDSVEQQHSHIHLFEHAKTHRTDCYFGESHRPRVVQDQHQHVAWSATHRSAAVTVGSSGTQEMWYDDDDDDDDEDDDDDDDT